MRTGRMSLPKSLTFKNITKVILLFGLMTSSLMSGAQDLTPTDSVTKPASASQLDSVNKQKPNQIESEIRYQATDSIVLFANGAAYLHGTTEMTYQNIKLEADFIRVKIDSSLIFAKGTLGEDEEMIGEPVFYEGETSYNSKELMYNLRTKKGFIRHVVTTEGEGYIISERTKKTPDDILCMAGGKYTTCDNHEHPHFYLNISKGKVKPGEYIVTGPANLVIADVPLPIALPFGFFPFTSKYSSGVLMPRYTDEMTRGFGLTNGGYYFALSEYFDLELMGDIYTKGTWAVSAATNYVKRYKFRGSFSFSYRNDVTGEKGLPDYSTSNNMSIRWSHSQDQKASPNFNFSANVNFSTSGYNRSDVNSYYRPELNSNNTKSSNITFSKRFPQIPSLNLSGSVNVAQRTKDSTINLSLPNINISYSRFNPFKRKNPTGDERWYEKISMQYTGSFANSIETKESMLLTSSFSRDWRNGALHRIPVSASFTAFKFINITPSFNYTERWLFKSIEKSWDKDAQRELIDTTSGFYRVYNFDMGVSASTKVYGFYIPSRKLFGDKIDRIRHVMTPNIGFSYTPDFSDPNWGYWTSYTKSVRSAADPTVFTDSEVTYSPFQGALYAPPSGGKSGNINFGIGNNLEMKVRDDKDTTSTTAYKVVSLIDALNINGGYNMAVDSFNWSNFSLNMRIKITKSYTLSLNTSFDPYMFGLTSSGGYRRINKLRWNNGMFPRFQGTGTSYSYTFNNDTFKKLFGKKEEENGADANSDQNQESSFTGETLGDRPDENSTSEKPKNKENLDEDGYAKVSIPWSVSVNYSVRYQNTQFNYDKMEFDMGFKHNLSVNGNVALTPNWRINGSTTYDFEAKQFTSVSISVNRSLHCWSMSANIVPFGPWKSYNFHLGVNASMLSDLKYDKRSDTGGGNMNKVTWY